MKSVVQLDEDNYFVGLTIADESPLEPGVFLIPGGAIDVDIPSVPEGKRTKWNGEWVFEDIPVDVSPEVTELTEDELEKMAQREALRLSAQGKLTALGLTLDEITAITP